MTIRARRIIPVYDPIHHVDDLADLAAVPTDHPPHGAPFPKEGGRSKGERDDSPFLGGGTRTAGADAAAEEGLAVLAVEEVLGQVDGVVLAASQEGPRVDRDDGSEEGIVGIVVVVVVVVVFVVVVVIVVVVGVVGMVGGVAVAVGIAIEEGWRRRTGRGRRLENVQVDGPDVVVGRGYGVRLDVGGAWLWSLSVCGGGDVVSGHCPSIL